VKIGIVGLPNAGKSTLFNALTRAGAEIGNYPFTTVDPNVAVVEVPDERLDRIVATIGASRVVRETIEFHDIAGLVRGASEGEGLGNRFLANIRETDAICHVVRAHDEAGVVHPDGRVDPLADLEAVEAELLLADLDSAERRLEKAVKTARSGDPEAIAEAAWLERVIAALGEGRPVRSLPVPEDAPEALRMLQPLTAKPVLYVANVADDSDEVPEAIAHRASEAGAKAVAVSARLEAELAELDPGEAAELRADLEVEPGLERVVRGARELLELVAFFTAGGGDMEARAWSLHRGLTAWDAAGLIHTDIQRGFVKAEVIAWDELIACGGYAGAREAGKLRIEGRDYVIRDGDVITVKHT